MASEKIKQPLRNDAKYPVLAAQIAAKIRSGEFYIGERLPTFIELQETYGVSMQTVNRAMIVLEQQKLIERRRGSGVYVMRRSIEKSADLVTGTLGVYGSGFAWTSYSSYWSHLLQGIQQAAQNVEQDVLLLKGNVGNGWEKIDGVLVADPFEGFASNAIPESLPVVHLFWARPGRASVVADERTGMRLATEHLLGLGHKRIGYLHSLDQTTRALRLDGYQEAFKVFDEVPCQSWIHSLSLKSDVGVQFVETGYYDMSVWLNDKSCRGWEATGCTALLCHNDETAIGAMRAFREAGWRIPEDVSIVGFDGLPISEYSSPRLTTVEMPLQKMGEIATQFLQRQIEADIPLEEHISLPTQLRLRESTCTPFSH